MEDSNINFYSLLEETLISKVSEAIDNEQKYYRSGMTFGIIQDAKKISDAKISEIASKFHIKNERLINLPSFSTYNLILRIKLTREISSSTFANSTDERTRKGVKLSADGRKKEIYLASSSIYKRFISAREMKFTDRYETKNPGEVIYMIIKLPKKFKDCNIDRGSEVKLSFGSGISMIDKAIEKI